MNWRRWFQPRRREPRTIEDEAWLMRAEERTAENEKRLIELVMEVHASVLKEDWKARHQ